MQNEITVTASKSLESFEKFGPAVEYTHCETVKEAKARAKYLLTAEYASMAEMSDPFGYTQVLVNGEVRHDFFSK